MKTQRIIGIALFLLGIILGISSGFISGDPQLRTWYQQYRIEVFVATGSLILIGLVLTFFSITGRHKPSSETEDLESFEPKILKEDQQFLKENLARHQGNLRILLKQKSTFAAGEEPLHLRNQIAAEEEAINEIEQKLRK